MHAEVWKCLWPWLKPSLNQFSSFCVRFLFDRLSCPKLRPVGIHQLLYCLVKLLLNGIGGNLGCCAHSPASGSRRMRVELDAGVNGNRNGFRGRNPKWLDRVLGVCSELGP